MGFWFDFTALSTRRPDHRPHKRNSEIAFIDFRVTVFDFHRRAQYHTDAIPFLGYRFSDPALNIGLPYNRNGIMRNWLWIAVGFDFMPHKLIGAKSASVALVAIHGFPPI